MGETDTEVSVRGVPQELEGIVHDKRLSDINLSERWGADSRDIGVIRSLVKYLSGGDGSRLENQPAGIKGKEQYRNLITRGTNGDGRVAKTLLAIIMELRDVKELDGTNEHIGSLVQEDGGLELMKRLVVPLLVEDLAIYAGWTGYTIPRKVQMEVNPTKKREGVMNYTADWIMEKMSKDYDMKHRVEAIENAELRDMALASAGVGVIIPERKVYA